MILFAPDAAAAAEVAAMVRRTTLDQPGFALLRFPHPLGSRALRGAMIGLIDVLPVRFEVERLGRFDQQVSSKFHRDGAPPASLLVLGYEATTVRSRLLIADASRAAAAAVVPLPEFVARHNPMFPAGEAHYLRFVTEVPLPHGESYLVAINNSLLPGPDGTNPLGVLHKAVIDAPDPAARRIINSIGLTLPGTAAVTSAAEVERFVSRDDLD
ncbi:hypothetical protein [Gemmata sp.]|uniref:hypothetical protein n=1 Tax=Gemmata sp. TaxID=1914242 RepID=UPI003F71E8F9